MQVFVFFMLLVTKDTIVNRDWGRSKKVQQLRQIFQPGYLEFKVGLRKIIVTYLAFEEENRWLFPELWKLSYVSLNTLVHPNYREHLTLVLKLLNACMFFTVIFVFSK